MPDNYYVTIIFAVIASFLIFFAYIAEDNDYIEISIILWILFMVIIVILMLCTGDITERENCASSKTHCNGWNCRICGEANTDQASCCGQCGTKKSGTGRWQCVCEQWNTGNYCTACGKAKDCCSSSWTCDCGTQNDTEYCCACGKKH